MKFRFASALGGIVAVAALLLSRTAVSATEMGPAKIAVERGSQVYFTYCVSCHGVNADGQGRRAAKLSVAPTDLTHRQSPAFNAELMIRKGGEALGRSSAMPPWEDELSHENIKDVMAYLEAIRVSR